MLIELVCIDAQSTDEASNMAAVVEARDIYAAAMDAVSPYNITYSIY